MHSAASPCAAWEILWLLENLGKPWKKQRLRPPGRQVPGSEAMRPPAARPGITMPYLENHWKTIGFCMFGQIAYDAFCCVPLRRMGNLMVIGKPWKTIGETWFPGHVGQKYKTNPLRIPFRDKADSQIYPLGTIGETLEIIGKSWFPGAVDPRLKTAPSDPFASEERWQNKKQAWICWFRPSDLISSHVICFCGAANLARLTRGPAGPDRICCKAGNARNVCFPTV